MGILIRKHHHAFVFSGIVKLAFIIFIVSLSSALIDTIWAVYLKEFLLNDSIVGFYSGFLSVLAFISFFIFVPLIEKTNKSLLYSSCLLLISFLYLIFAVNKNLVLFLILSIAITFLATIRITSLGIIVRDKSGKSLLKNEGMVYSFNNTAWVIGPLIAGLVLIELGISFVFISSAFLIFLAFVLFKFSGIRDSNIVKKTHNNVLGNFLEFFKNKDRVICYIISGGINLWWVFIYLYMPLFIIENGLNKMWIGVFLFFVALPLIVLEYPFSRAAGKYGTKRFFLTGYFFTGLMAVLSFVFVSNVYLVLAFLTIASIGMAMLEPTTEAYFFEIVKNKKEENRFYGPYNTTIETGLILGKFAPAILLLFLPFKYIFLLFSGFMFLLFFLSFKAKKIVEGTR